MINVVFETGHNRRQTIKKAAEQLDQAFLDRCNQATTIFIKINLVDYTHPLANTHVDAVRGLLDVITQYSNATIYIGDAAYKGTDVAFDHLGYRELPKEYNRVQLIDLQTAETTNVTIAREDGSQQLMKQAALTTKADVKISLTPMKIDTTTGVSLSIQNWTIGTLIVPPRISTHGRVWARWPWMEEQGAYTHHSNITALYEQSPFDVAIIDATLAMEGEGPVRGTPVETNYVLAGTDPLAVDAVAATMMGIEPSEIGYLALAAEKELGVIDLGKINVPPMQLTQHTRTFTHPFGFHERMTGWQHHR